MNPALIDMINYTESKGFEVLPVREKKGIRFTIHKNDKLLKIGQKRYKTILQGQLEVYTKLYEAITK